MQWGERKLGKVKGVPQEAQHGEDDAENKEEEEEEDDADGEDDEENEHEDDDDEDGEDDEENEDEEDEEDEDDADDEDDEDDEDDDDDDDDDDDEDDEDDREGGAPVFVTRGESTPPPPPPPPSPIKFADSCRVWAPPPPQRPDISGKKAQNPSQYIFCFKAKETPAGKIQLSWIYIVRWYASFQELSFHLQQGTSDSCVGCRHLSNIRSHTHKTQCPVAAKEVE